MGATGLRCQEQDGGEAVGGGTGTEGRAPTAGPGSPAPRRRWRDAGGTPRLVAGDLLEALSLARPERERDTPAPVDLGAGAAAARDGYPWEDRDLPSGEGEGACPREPQPPARVHQ